MDSVNASDDSYFITVDGWHDFYHESLNSVSQSLKVEFAIAFAFVAFAAPITKNSELEGGLNFNCLGIIRAVWLRYASNSHDISG